MNVKQLRELKVQNVAAEAIRSLGSSQIMIKSVTTKAVTIDDVKAVAVIVGLDSKLDVRLTERLEDYVRAVFYGGPMLTVWVGVPMFGIRTEIAVAFIRDSGE